MRIIIFSLFALMLVGCSGSRSIDPELLAEFSTQYESVEVERYKIGTGDMLDVNVWGNPELTLTVPVRPDGYISMPLIGDVAASGMDAEALAEEVTELLSVQLRNPLVTIVVSQVNSSLFLSRVRVTGAVMTPISMPYARGMSVLDAILAAGGVSDVASSNRAKLYRTINESLVEVDVRLGDILLRGRLETNFSLQPGDVITVPERIF